MLTKYNPIIPFAVACLGIAVFSSMDGFMKGLSIAIGAYNAMLWRLLVSIPIAGAVFLFRREKLPSRSALRLHLLRGTIAAFMATTFFWGLARLPMAEAIALSFVAPIITLYLAAVLLKEEIGKNAFAASFLGLAGMAVILWGRLGVEDYDEQAIWGAGSVFVSALLYAYNLILQRQQAQVATPVEITLFQNLVAGSVLLLAAPAFAVFPAATHWQAILISAVTAMIALLLLSWAYARAEAQMLVTVEYTAFIWAAIFGWIMYREPVTGPTIFGAILIITGCLIATRGKPEHVETTAL
jgi:drug/metabolite transporter (DMT)-like permease